VSASSPGHALEGCSVGVEDENGVAEDLSGRTFRLSLSTIVALNKPIFPCDASPMQKSAPCMKPSQNGRMALARDSAFRNEAPLRDFLFAVLDIGASLELEVWDLELFPLRPVTRGHFR